ncbi:uncharacterized protein NPIL_184591 [Nephila pilipes]|uniref:IGFBP N-terminal domain-containing protein n=1 Tax=Nephila pilipes TaxID=299642 RepID=A0A8X6R426_NEPPI|nr:uncharacterized protein NPIL_184591 [Nephila pilipes]
MKLISIRCGDMFLRKRWLLPTLIHTGDSKDRNMGKGLFMELGGHLKTTMHPTHPETADPNKTSSCWNHTCFIAITESCEMEFYYSFFKGIPTMKNLVLFSSFLTLFIVLIVNVESTSPVMCPEKCYPCEPVNCDCGTYKDQCNCCDICMKCRNAPCSVLEGNVCEEGYTCGDPTRDYMVQMNSPATCIPVRPKA